MADSESPVQFGDFAILERIGAGGMGIVFKARQLSLGRDVALKILGPALSDPNAIARLKREAQAAGKLKHPNIAAVYFVGQDRSSCFIAMEYVAGASLKQVIDYLKSATDPTSSIDSAITTVRHVQQPTPARFDALDVDTYVVSDNNTFAPAEVDVSAAAAQRVQTRQHIERCCEIVSVLALALEHAHQAGVIHRDIKPGNLMLGLDGTPHIIDFGLARFTQDETLTQSGQLIGTPVYMSPEEVTGRLEADCRTDVYSLGLVLYELLTLQCPFRGPTRDSILRKVVTKQIPPVTSLNRQVSMPLESVIHRATAKDPDDRYQTAQEFAEDLQRAMSGRAVIARPYRFAHDYSEIDARRPVRVTVVAFIFFSMGTLYLLSGIAGFYEYLSASYQDLMRTQSTLGPVPLGYATLLYCIACVAWSYYVAYVLMSGHRWCRYAVLATCIALLNVLGAGFAISRLISARGRFDVEAVVFGLSLPGYIGCTWLVFTKPVTQWLRIAQQIRSDVAGITPFYKDKTIWVGLAAFTNLVCTVALQYAIRWMSW
jgi:serine/threonine protein kinase